MLINPPLPTKSKSNKSNFNTVAQSLYDSMTVHFALWFKAIVVVLKVVLKIVPKLSVKVSASSTALDAKENPKPQLAHHKD